MARKKNVQPPPKKFAAPKLKEVEGAWSVSYNHIDRDGPFAWPEESSAQFHQIATFMARLSLLEIEECNGILRANGRPAHGPTTGGLSDAAEARLSDLIASSEQLERLLFDGEITRFSYCYDYSQSRRVYGIRSGAVLYLLWWDPNHEVTGSQTPQDSPPCTGHRGCHH